MFGQTSVTQSNYVVADSFGTNGPEVASFIFRIVVSAVRQLRISLQEIIAETEAQQQMCAAIEAAFRSEDVDLSFLTGEELTQIIAGLPKRLFELFVLRYRCRCGEQDEVISIVVTNVKCDKCSCQMVLEQAPVISFTKFANQISQSIYGEKYCLNGLFTTENYSVLVDFENLEKGSKDVFLLEAMEGSGVMKRNYGKIEQLTFLEPGRLKDYLSGSEKSVKQEIGAIKNVCWFNQAYLTNKQLEALDLPHNEEQIEVAADEPTTERENMFEKPVYQPEEPSFANYTWIIYAVLLVLFVLLFILMILLSILIDRQNKTMRVESIHAKGVTFASVPEVERIRDIQPYLDSFQTITNDNVRQKSYISKHSMYMGATQIDRVEFGKMQFDNASIAEMSPPLQPTASSNVRVENLTCDRLTTGTTVAAAANLSGSVIFENAVTLNAMQGSVANTTTESFSTETVNSSGEINCQYLQADQLTSNAVDAQECKVAGQLVAAQAECERVSTVDFNPSNVTFQGNLLLETLEVNDSTISLNGILSSSESIIWNYENMVFNGNLHIENLTCPNVVANESISGDNAAFLELKLNGGFTVAGDLNLKKITVMQSSTIGQFVTNEFSTQTVNASTSVSFGGYGSMQPTSATFSATSHTIGQFQADNEGFRAEGAVNIDSANVAVEGSCFIGTIDAESAAGKINAENAITPNITATECLLSSLSAQTISVTNVTATELTATSLNVGTSEFARTSGDSVLIDAYMIKSQMMCDYNGEAQNIKEREIFS